ASIRISPSADTLLDRLPRGLLAAGVRRVRAVGEPPVLAARARAVGAPGHVGRAPPCRTPPIDASRASRELDVDAQRKRQRARHPAQDSRVAPRRAAGLSM